MENFTATLTGKVKTKTSAKGMVTETITATLVVGQHTLIINNFTDITNGRPPLVTVKMNGSFMSKSTYENTIKNLIGLCSNTRTQLHVRTGDRAASKLIEVVNRLMGPRATSVIRERSTNGR